MDQPATIGFGLSPQQKHIWAAHQDSSAYRVQGSIQIEGSLEPDALVAALTTIVEQHTVLRTTFQRRAGRKMPIQVIHDLLPLRLRTHDLSDLDAVAQDRRCATLFDLLRQESFDLVSGPLLHVVLIKRGPQSHRLLLSLPAVCGDTWTLLNMIQELSRLYNSSGAGGEQRDDVVQYVQFAEWQNELLAEPDAVQGQQFWEQQLASATTVRLPYELPSAQRQPGMPASYAWSIEPEQLRAVSAFAQQQARSEADVLLACWYVLLGRLSAQTDITVSTFLDGRKYDGFADAFGPFSQPVPVSSQCPLDLPFATLLQQVAAAKEAAYEWQEYFSWPDQRAGGSPLDAPVGFEFDAGPAEYHGAGLTLSLAQHYSYGSPTKLRLTCLHLGDRLSATLYYDPQRFSAATITRLAQQYSTVLSDAIERPSVAIGELTLMSQAEYRQLLIDLNQTATDQPAPLVIELFDAQAERTPHATAVVCGTQQLSYGELAHRANQLAHQLRADGVGPDVLVGLCVERSVEMLVGVLGILKAGGAYVPLDPDMPGPRLAQQVIDSGLRVIVTQAQYQQQLAALGTELLCLDRDRERLERQPSTAPSHQAQAAQLAYVIYTSGSTGTPKGVAVMQGGLANYTRFICDSLSLQAGLHFATVSTIAADLGNTVIFPALTTGGCLHILGYELVTDGQRFAEYVASQQIDVLKIVPSHLQALLTAHADSALPRQYLILGGEALSWELVDRIARSKATCRVINHYGPTETTIGSLTYDVSAHQDEPRLAATVPIGRPIANTQVYVLDQQQRPVATGMQGELHIGGSGVARGYLGQAAQTSAQFIPNPFVADRTARLYKTGDLVRHLPDGTIEFLGRVDHQVKIRGFRIELGEIESTLLQHPQVQSAVVVAQREQETSEPQLVAYVVPTQGAAPSAHDLRQFVRERLPSYMAPAMVALLDALPLTRNGKVDRKALPNAAGLRPASSSAYIAPHTEAERQLAAIWQEVLPVAQVGVNDNFFDLGGHSLLMVQVHSRMRAVFERDLPMTDLFKYPTVRTLAQHLTQSQPTQPILDQAQSRADARRAAIRPQRVRPSADEREEIVG